MIPGPVRRASGAPPSRRSPGLWRRSRRWLATGFWGWLLGALLQSSAQAAILTTIVTNGPSTNRVNLVLFAEGYTSGQQSAFLQDATNAAAAFLGAEPYAEYARFFNVFAIYTNSATAGSTHLITQSYAPGATFFNSSYDDYSDYFITIPPNAVDANPSHGQGKINALLWTNYAAVWPRTNTLLAGLLVNDPTRGGSDGGSSDYGLTAITYTGPDLSYILVHESGHTLASLGDEYATAYPGYPTNDVEPNTTVETNFNRIKWRAWIAPNTPLPTPTAVSNLNSVGAFEGAHYHQDGWYRPAFNCTMNSDGTTFCPVCQEALALAIYGKVRPIDSQLPATNSLTYTTPTNLSFTLNLLAPTTHALSVQWRTNGAVVGSATGTNLTLGWAQLGNGSHQVEADVWDATGLVRTDARSVLKQTNLWNINLAVPGLRLDSLRWLGNGDFALRVTGLAPAGVVIQLSTNLLQWLPVQTNAFTGGTCQYTNPGAGKTSPRFFRAVTAP